MATTGQESEFEDRGVHEEVDPLDLTDLPDPFDLPAPFDLPDSLDSTDSLHPTDLLGGGDAVLATESAEPRAQPAAEAADGAASGRDEARLRICLARVVRREEDALEELYDALVGRVFSVALRVTGNPQTAEEAAEDTFWQVWREAPRFDPTRGTVAAWIVTIARSRALDALRRADRAFSDPEPDALAERTRLVGDDPHDLVAASQDSRRLQSALGALDPLPRQLVSLAFFRGMTHEEISGVMHLPLGTVKSHIRRALESMRQALAPV